MRNRRIASCESGELCWGEESFSYRTPELKLCLCEALYLPPLRGTFFQKKASEESLRDIF